MGALGTSYHAPFGALFLPLYWDFSLTVWRPLWGSIPRQLRRDQLGKVGIRLATEVGTMV